MGDSTLELIKVFGPVAGFGVLMWILLREQLRSHSKHLEGKDSQLERVLTSHLAAEAGQRTEYSEWQKQQHVEFRTTFDRMLDHSRVQFEGLAKALRDDLMALHKAIDTLDDTVKLFLKEKTQR